MKKARTLLAIWLALILTLTLFPTALAEPTTDVAEPFTATYTASEGITFNSNPTTVEPNASLEVTFTVADGYELSKTSQLLWVKPLTTMRHNSLKVSRRIPIPFRLLLVT